VDIPWADEEDDMVSVTVGGWESSVCDEVNQSSRFNVFLIGLSC
jgi:hypothetical protein